LLNPNLRLNERRREIIERKKKAFAGEGVGGGGGKIERRVLAGTRVLRKKGYHDSTRDEAGRREGLLYGDGGHSITGVYLKDWRIQ